MNPGDVQPKQQLARRPLDQLKPLRGFQARGHVDLDKIEIPEPSDGVQPRLGCGPAARSNTHGAPGFRLFISRLFQFRLRISQARMAVD